MATAASPLLDKDDPPDGIQALLQSRFLDKKSFLPDVSNIFVMLALVPCRVLNWYAAGWAYIVATDAGYVSKQDFAQEAPEVKAVAMMVSMFNVFNGIAVSLVIVAFTRTVQFNFKEDIEQFWKQQKLIIQLQMKHVEEAEDQMSTRSECEKRHGKTVREQTQQADKSATKFSQIALGLGIAITLMHTGVMIGGILDIHSGDADQRFKKAGVRLIQKVSSFRFWVNSVNGLGQFITGLIISFLMSIVVHTVSWLVRNLKWNTKRLIDHISAQEGQVDNEFMMNTAAEVWALQQQLNLSQTRSFGWIFSMVLMIPFMEMLYWLFNLAMLSEADVSLERRTRGLASFAAGIGCLCCFAIIAIAYMLSNVSSKCTKLRGVINSLRLRADPRSFNPQKSVQDIFAKEEVNRQISQINDYMQNCNNGDPMGFYVLGVRMSTALFKSMLVSYVSILAFLAPKALQFFRVDSGNSGD